MPEDTPITITKNPNYAVYERQAKDAQNAAQNAASANPAGAVQNAQNAQAANIAKGQAQNAQAQARNLGLTKPVPKSAPKPTPKSAPKSKPAPKPTTGNKALDTMQQIKREKQPEPVKQTPQSMYDRNGNRIIQGNGTFERRQRQAAGQDQQFQNPTGYDIGAVTNQVSQNSQLPVQAPQNSQPPAQASGMFGRTYDNRRFNNAMGYLNKTFTGKKVTLDDGSQVDASQYFQDNLNRILKGTNNPKALKFYLRSLQEDMARRGVGNFDISGELLKGTGMTDGGFAKYMWNNRNQFMTQEQRPVIPSPKPTGGSGNKKPATTGGSGNKKPATTKYGAPLIKCNTMEQNTKIQNRFDPASLSLKFAEPLTFDGLMLEYRKAYEQKNIARMRILNNQMKKLYPDQYKNAQKLNVTGSI